MSRSITDHSRINAAICAAKLQEIARLEAEAAQMRAQLAKLTALEAHTVAILRDTYLPTVMRVRRAESYLKRNARRFRRAGEVQG